MTFETRASIGVVSKEKVASIEERAAQHGLKLAQEVIQLAAEQIAVWDSHYTSNESFIRKAIAIDELPRALKRVLQSRDAVRKIVWTITRNIATPSSWNTTNPRNAASRPASARDLERKNDDHRRTSTIVDLFPLR